MSASLLLTWCSWAYKGYRFICFLSSLTDKFLFACLFLFKLRGTVRNGNGLCLQGCCNLFFFATEINSNSQVLISENQAD